MKIREQKSRIERKRNIIRIMTGVLAGLMLMSVVLPAVTAYAEGENDTEVVETFPEGGESVPEENAEAPTAAEGTEPEGQSAESPAAGGTTLPDISAPTASSETAAAETLSDEEKTIRDLKWDLTPDGEKSKKFNIKLDQSVTRFTVVYSKNADAPEIVFRNGSEVLDTESPVLQHVPDPKGLVVRKDISLSGYENDYSGLRFMAVYVAGEEQLDGWVAEVTLKTTPNFLIIIKNEAPADWSSMQNAEEYIPHETAALAWGIYEGYTPYTISDIGIISSGNADSRAVAPVEVTEPAPQPKDTNPLVYILAIVIFLIVLFIGFLIFLQFRDKRRYREHKEAQVAKMNRRVERKKAESDETLEQTLFEDDYSDDDVDIDLANYFSSDRAMKEEEEVEEEDEEKQGLLKRKKPEPKKPARKEDDPDYDPDFDMDIDEKPEDYRIKNKAAVASVKPGAKRPAAVKPVRKGSWTAEEKAPARAPERRPEPAKNTPVKNPPQKKTENTGNGDTRYRVRGNPSWLS